MYGFQRDSIRRGIAALRQEIERLDAIKVDAERSLDVRMQAGYTSGWLEGVAQSLAITVDSDEAVAARHEAKQDAAVAVEAATA